MPKGGNEPTSDSIKVLVFDTTAPCAGFLQPEREAQRAAQRFPAGRVVAGKHDAFSVVGKENQVGVTPTIIVAGRKVAFDKALTEDRIAEILTTLLRRNYGVSSAWRAQTSVERQTGADNVQLYVASTWIGLAVQATIGACLILRPELPAVHSFSVKFSNYCRLF
ncbi:MAG: hypothetical protein ABSG35_19030 [Syntrophobacteraceae bacterium]|jgi:hypothetical protein